MFQIDRIELKRLISKRAATRRALAVKYRDLLKALSGKMEPGNANDYKRERLEQSARVNEDYADFLAFAREHLAPSTGPSRMTPYDLRVLDLLPSTSVD